MNDLEQSFANWVDALNGVVGEDESAIDETTEIIHEAMLTEDYPPREMMRAGFTVDGFLLLLKLLRKRLDGDDE